MPHRATDPRRREVEAPEDQPAVRSRAETNALARAAAERIAKAVAEQYAAAQGWAGRARSVDVRRLADGALLRHWLAAPDGLDPADAAATWAELGDGVYLMELRDPHGAHVLLVVEVAGGQAETAQIDEADLPAIRALLASREAPGNSRAPLWFDGARFSEPRLVVEK